MNSYKHKRSAGEEEWGESYNIKRVLETTASQVSLGAIKFFNIS
jgi:hypothetical protein